MKEVITATLKRSLQRDQFLQIIIGSLLVVFGLWIAQNIEAYFTSIVLLGSASALALIYGIFLVKNGISFLNVQKHPLYLLLQEKPKKIVWVYSVLTVRQPFGFELFKTGTLYFKLSDREVFEIYLREKEILPFTEALSTLLPHASFGYTKEKEEWYETEPLLLLQNDLEPEDFDRD